MANQSYWQQPCKIEYASNKRKFDLGRLPPIYTAIEGSLKTCLESYFIQTTYNRELTELTLEDGTVLTGLEIETLADRPGFPG